MVLGNAILVTTNVVGFYQSIPHAVGLRTLNEALDKGYEKTTPTEKLLKMAEFLLKNNYFEFGTKIKQHICETANCTRVFS